ncbi:hypothetical protein GQ43DRAFT_364104 [Delitschia confertaspora ATCC 74209]|uniref:Tubulin-specific chaperone D C-terminal domain-containing protein n=1 Tax=Delitschia confertaspora ATCC 74209 TaxID=1513339 RepID=A0A9P4JWW8_9PLEO|nr:hypothetical protein GQ43DRAFT_364104 [Delitschia confertaspora ATCC 74209]
MNAVEDDDIKLQRASSSLLSDLHTLLNRVLRKPKNGQVHRRVKESDLDRIFTLVEPFQEDPQLLDTYLKHCIPPLVDAYLAYMGLSPKPEPRKHFVPLSHAVCRILNLFCKVRGEKVIAGFLNNEPRYLEAILHEHEKGENFPSKNEESLSQKIVPWEERYILLLWLSHLMLAPFPLASISAPLSSQETSSALGIDLPAQLPGIVLRILPICLNGLQSATKERNAAANLLVRLSVRPDMQKVGLLTALAKWGLAFFSNISETFNIHECLGVLSFLSGLVTSANAQEIGPYISAVYQSCQNIINQSNLDFVKSSAVARKLVIKTLRNIVVHCLQTTESPEGLDTTTVLEEVIGFLLETLADGDTPVRYAASKALSIITMKLDPEMASEVVEAILGSLNENVYWQGSKRNLSGVNPLRWHGSTLTLSHLLYRKALSTDQLPDVLNALLVAQAFEQRSATGGSVGTNVRDAACFGIWALSRRYSTKDLLEVETASIRASHQRYHSLSVPQLLAIELLVVASLDPAGNIRRGSSAALQELIGRHPNTVEEGISLVQIIDFHAVGLRERAMTDVAIKAAQLHHMYWEALFENLLEWRGTGSLDSPSRIYAATAIGRVIQGKDAVIIHGMVKEICDKLKSLKPREVEERHGLVMALSYLVDEVGRVDASESIDLAKLWGLLTGVLKLENKSFISPTLRPELTAVSICNLLGSLGNITCRRSKASLPEKLPRDEIIRLLNLCLGRSEESVLQAIPRTVWAVLELLSKTSPESKGDVISTWLNCLENEVSFNKLRGSGYAIALGAAYSQLADPATDGAELSATDDQRRIVTALTHRCTPNVDISARTVALQAVEVLLQKHQEFKSSQKLPGEVKDKITSVLHIALNDYTVTERGDVGSLVRLEALNTVEMAWRQGLVDGSTSGERLHEDILRLSLEKLDKVRARAAHVLEIRNSEYFNRAVDGFANGVSSYTYFSESLKLLSRPEFRSVKDALLVGFISSAGIGSESVVQNARLALVDYVDSLPTQIPDDPEQEAGFSLLQLATLLTGLLRANLSNDRVLIPLLEVLAFLFDMQILQRLVDTNYRHVLFSIRSLDSFRTLLSLTQKAHFKSAHMHKLHLALDLYRGLGTIPATRSDTLTKVTNMLLHPFPKIRIAAAETLWCLSNDQDLKRHDWSLSNKSLKPVAEGLKSRIIGT